MELTVYTVSGAPRGWRVLLGLAFKGLDYEIKYLEASKNEHKSADFREINPRGTVPVLDAEGLILRDSIAILAWLDRQYPRSPLFGETAQTAASNWQATMECSDYLRAATNDLLYPVLVQGISLPEKESEERVSLDEAAQQLLAEIGFLEDLLADRPFFGGDVPGAIDAVVFPEIRLIQRALTKKAELMNALGFDVLVDNYPKITAWVMRVSELDGVAKTFPRHWVE